MSSFSSELGVQFGTCLEAPHVIDVESQVQMTFLCSSIVFIGSFWFNRCSSYEINFVTAGVACYNLHWPG